MGRTSEELGYTVSALGPDPTAIGDPVVAGLVSLIQDQERGELGAVETSASEIDMSVRGADAAPHLAFVARRDGEPVAVIMAEVFPELREVYFDLYRRSGVPLDVAADLLARHESAARAHAADLEERGRAGPTEAPTGQPPIGPPPVGNSRYEPHPALWQFMAGLFEQETDLRAVYEHHGYRHVRTFFRMRVAFDGPREAAVPPPGVILRRVDTSDDADLRLVHRLFLEAFDDHWGQGQRGFDSWLSSHRDSADFDPEGWFVALLDGRPVGELQMSHRRREFDRGYVDTLGVLRDARGRGVATALLQHAFDVCAARGQTGCELGVDTDSPTGADRLYLRNGMQPASVLHAFCKPFE